MLGKKSENAAGRARVEERFLRDWGFELPDSIFRFSGFLESLGPVEHQALREVGVSPAGIMDLFADPGLRPRDGIDVRVHGRYYRDPPEFLTFMHAGSDGLHHGLWFDDGRTCRGVASYYNNDGDGTGSTRLRQHRWRRCARSSNATGATWTTMCGTRRCPHASPAWACCARR